MDAIRSQQLQRRREEMRNNLNALRAEVYGGVRPAVATANPTREEEEAILQYRSPAGRGGLRPTSAPRGAPRTDPQHRSNAYQDRGEYAARSPHDSMRRPADYPPRSMEETLHNQAACIRQLQHELDGTRRLVNEQKSALTELFARVQDPSQLSDQDHHDLVALSRRLVALRDDMESMRSESRQQRRNAQSPERQRETLQALAARVSRLESDAEKHRVDSAALQRDHEAISALRHDVKRLSRDVEDVRDETSRVRRQVDHDRQDFEELIRQNVANMKKTPTALSPSKAATGDSPRLNEAGKPSQHIVGVSGAAGRQPSQSQPREERRSRSESEDTENLVSRAMLQANRGYRVPLESSNRSSSVSSAGAAQQAAHPRVEHVVLRERTRTSNKTR